MIGRSVLPRRKRPGRTRRCRVHFYCDQQPNGRAMIQMASVFSEQERQIIRSRVNAGLDRVRAQGKKRGRPKVPPKVEAAIRENSSVGRGILKQI
jgi:DNA invertase Pin-like site-specific DNA recombinase